jgi:hypothetical protein
MMGPKMQTESTGQSERRTVETPVEARQGFLDRPVLIVLVASIVLVVVAFAVLWLPGII